MFQKLRDLLTPASTSNVNGPAGAPSADAPAAVPPRLPGTESAAAPDARDSAVLAGWETRQLDGRRIDVYQPGRATTPSTAVLFLHGHGEVLLQQNVAFSRLFHQHNLAVVCPAGRRGWWLDVVCDEFDAEITPQQWLLESVVPFVASLWGIAPPQLALLGVSMGGQGALQLAYRHPSLFPVVAAISPAVDFYQLYGTGIPLDRMFDSAEAARQASVVLNLHPLAWPRHQFFCCDPADTDWFDGCARLGMKLSSSGILHERDLETSGGGHSWEYFNRMAERAIRHIVNACQT